MSKKPLISHIITGKWRGRKVVLPENPAVRPTRNMVLQAGFNLLTSHINFSGLRGADICCGSGQWGLEALSRGAQHIDFIDVDTRPVAANLAALGAEAECFTLHQQPIEKMGDSLKNLDVIFADPPYESGLYDLLLARPMWGRKGAIWLLEGAADLTLAVPDAYKTLVHRVYGGSSLWLLEQVAESA